MTNEHNKNLIFNSLNDFHKNDLRIRASADFEKLQKSLVRPFHDFEKLQKSLVSPFHDLEKLQKSLISPFHDLEKLQKSVISPFADFEKIQKSLISPFADFEKIQKEAFSSLSEIKRLEKSFINLDYKDLQNSINVLKKSGVIDSLYGNNSIQTLVDSINKSELVDSVTLKSNSETGSSKKTVHLERVQDTEGFFKQLIKLPPSIQCVILLSILLLIRDISINIVANIATPYVQNIIKSSDQPQKSKIKSISSINIDGVNLEGLRFVNVDNLILREKANSKSLMLDNLEFGQVVKVVSRQKNWLEITYKYENGEIMHGWVFARYTSKFKY